MDEGDEALMKAYKWQKALITDQDANIRLMLNQTLPRSYLRVSINDKSLPAAWGATGDSL
ncbi:hypothetical protein V7S43_014620 [Phytophthora oleae]|uniref:Uncharacterized protein n=1 Tax=Phytophthora oleae TaxID=2107226 RepID=A0ABD3F3B1_9STRA